MVSDFLQNLLSLCTACRLKSAFLPLPQDPSESAPGGFPSHWPPRGFGDILISWFFSSNLRTIAVCVFFSLIDFPRPYLFNPGRTSECRWDTFFPWGFLQKITALCGFLPCLHAMIVVDGSFGFIQQGGCSTHTHNSSKPFCFRGRLYRSPLKTIVLWKGISVLQIATPLGKIICCNYWLKAAVVSLNICTFPNRSWLTPLGLHGRDAPLF